MKQRLQQVISSAIDVLIQQGQLPAELNVPIVIERTRDAKNGDFACNVALSLAKAAKKNPRELAQLIVAASPKLDLINKIEIAGPGFINFFLTEQALHEIVHEILAARSNFGTSKIYQGTKILLEFVSCNPTGPLHVGHGRSAAFGASLANLLQAVGFDVHSEYYVNDAGRQMDILATSLWLRYLQLCGEEFAFPSNGYKGDYLQAIAKMLKHQFHKKLMRPLADVYANVPDDLTLENSEGDKEAHIDVLIQNAKHLLAEDYHSVFTLALNSILGDIKQDLQEFRVNFDEWFSEKSLLDSGALEHCIDVLDKKGYLYKREGALWFKSTDFGDDKDRVVRRANGQHTYFASDIAYHLNKLERGNHLLIDVLGADHHGYVPRVHAAVQALSGKTDVLIAPIIQFVSLYRGKEKISMSTRGGDFITLRELRNEVGNDAARFFYIMRKADQHMDFDLVLAKSTSNENPVYYIQYAHARICSVLRQLSDKKFQWSTGQGIEFLNLLTASIERTLLKTLQLYPETIEIAAIQYAPHTLAHYLRGLAMDFHSYYNSHQFIIDDAKLCQARLNLIAAIKQVLENGLALLGISAPEQM